MKQFEDTYKPLPEGLTIMESKIEGLGLYAQTDFSAGHEFGETHVFAVSTNRRPNCYINTDSEERTLYSVRPIKSGEELTVYYRFESYDGMTG